MSKLVLIGVAAAAYVLGTKDGRERYEQFMRTAQRWKDDPRIQEKASEAAGLVKERAPDVKDRVTSTVRDAAGKVGKNGTEGQPPSTTGVDTAR